MNKISRLFFVCIYLINRKCFFVLLLSTCAFNPVQAQLVINESFESPVGLLPIGWSHIKVGNTTGIYTDWSSINPGINPCCTPRTGTFLLRFNSYIIPANEAAAVFTQKLDMRNGMPAGGANFNFWLRRNSVIDSDRFSVYVNDSAVFSGGPTGALLLNENVTSTPIIYRANSLPPVAVTPNGWNQYFYTIPNISPYNGGSVYIIIVATSENGDDILIDDMTVNTYPMNQSYVASSAEVIYQDMQTTAINKPNELIIGCKLVMSGSASPRVLTNMEFNTNGCTNPPTDILNAKLWFTGNNMELDTALAQLLGTYSNPWLTNFSFLTTPNANYTGMSSFNGLQHGDNYFFITYRTSSGAPLGHKVDAEWINFTLNGVVQSSPNPQTLPGDREFDVSYCSAQHGFWCWVGGFYTDFINSVTLVGDNIPPPGINNNLNYVGWNFLGWQPYTNCPPPYPSYCPFSNPPMYELFDPVPGKTTSITANGTYSISLQVGSYGNGNYIAAWIDFNHDGVFSPAEKIAQSGMLTAYGIYTTSFTVPVGSNLGQTRLRVRESWLQSNIQPCTSYIYGETEDYQLNVIPECPAVPGWTTWIGLTDEWADPANWCPSIAPISGNPDVNVRIPGGPTGTYTYHQPVIRDSVQARALKLRIEGTDIIHVDATRGSSLTVLDSLTIQTANGALVVNSSHVDSTQVYNGLLPRPTDSPLSSSQRARSFLSFTQAELLAKGLRAGDMIIGIRIHIQRKSNGNPYKNFTVKYYYTTTPQGLFGAGAAANIPLPTGAPAAPVTVFSGDLDPDSFVPVLNDYGTIILPLATPINWNGGANPLVIEMCYDNTGFPLTGTNDEMRFTQTTSLRRYMTIENLSAYNKAGCSLTPKDTVISPSTGSLGSNLLTVAVIDAIDILPGQLTSLGSQVVSIAGNVVTLSANLPMNVNGNVTFYNALTSSMVYRPNLTFEFSRLYNKFPISVAGHWENNGLFTAGLSRVTLNGTISNQKVQGISQTTFFDLTISNPNHVLRVTDFTVTDSLHLFSGRLKLNNGLVTLTNNSSTALTRTSGYIQTETDIISSNVFPFGRLHWQMGSTPGLRVIPFISSFGNYLPLDYNMDSGTHDVIFSTYGTLTNNTNIPAPEVTSIAGPNNALGGGAYGSDGWAMVDRYFMIDNTTGVSPQADITFRYATTEQAQSGNSNMKGQRWLNNSDNWEFPFQPGQTFIGGSPNSVQLSNFTGFTNSTWWTLIGNDNPLPVSLLEFSAEKVDHKVKLSWTIASEFNNSHFEIERTTDNQTFDFISRVESYGPGNNLRKYETWDHNPVNGIQYYYLKQFDFDGNVVKYGPGFADFSDYRFEIVSATSSVSHDRLTVTFYYNSDEPFSYRIMDMTGRIIVAEDRNAAIKGINVIDIETNLAQGAYQIILQNSERVVSQKFFY